MKILIVGHRGTGKAAVLARLPLYIPELQAFDLDREVELASGRSIARIFETEGEQAFRTREQLVFQQILQQVSQVSKPVAVVAGAGFECRRALPEEWQVWWVRRETDEKGRVFTQRPRLNSKVSPWQEYHERFVTREGRYCQLADRVLTLSEGFDSPTSFEEAWLLERLSNLGGFRTVLPSDVARWSRAGEGERDEAVVSRKRQKFAETRLAWGVDGFELRDDLLDPQELKHWVETIPRDKLLLSFRDVELATQTKKIWCEEGRWDWPVEWLDPLSATSNELTSRAAPPSGDLDIVSLHERLQGQSLADCLQRLDRVPGRHHKLAVPIRNLEELRQGWVWQQTSRQTRSFLPMSEEGRWAWFRLRTKGEMFLQFWREEPAMAKDQPILFDWLRWQKEKSKMGAVLGWPVSHSRTPAEQFQFFLDHGLNSAAVPLPEQEATAEAFAFLRELGLEVAAVTSPLKSVAWKTCADRTLVADDFQMVNTLVGRTGPGWLGHNTDWQGLQASWQEVRDFIESERWAPLERGTSIENLSIAIWGGGGTLPLLQRLVPHAVPYAARTGDVRAGFSELNRVDIVIWAVGRPHAKTHPPAEWQPQLVWDLNYSEDSPGREFALQRGCRYISGQRMFEVQAAAQREFWSRELSKV